MKLSIITPNYNYAAFISETIRSVAEQDYFDIEHIIVDDGSTDNSVKIIQDMQNELNSKIILIKQENRGQTAAINTGLKAASGDIIGWINSDDAYCRNVFGSIMKIFELNEKIDIVFGDVNVVDSGGKTIYRLRHFPFSYWESVFVGFSNTLTSNAVFWRRRLTSEVGMMEESLLCNMDGEYFSRITWNRCLFYMKVPLANFRKQEYTIASKDISDWETRIEIERNKTQCKAYQNLVLSNILSFKYTAPIRWFFLIVRLIKRIVYFHYVLKSVEKFRYKYFSGTKIY